MTKEDILKKRIDDKEVFDEEANTIDYRKQNINDLKFNKGIRLPDKLDLQMKLNYKYLKTLY